MIRFAHSTSRGARLPTVPAGLGALGIICVVTGLFLPWLLSGEVSRNIFATAGAAERLGVIDTGFPVTTALALLGPSCMIPVILAALRWHRTAAVVALPIALVCLLLSCTVTVAGAGRHVIGIRLSYAGPIVVMVGSICLLVGAVGVLATRGHPRRGRKFSRVGPNR